ncbi:glycosyltransferase [Flammeovirga sp. OC4]|uniref:glycosyltransferase n=1 Tax=Flammeovirga sp. OC4 TaxID=1382345 RepID=UPI0005C439BD|nr:glycosyltransferase [Flammeovirga sp. OC4]
MSIAPICIFTYNRLEETRKTISSLKKNYLASESHVYIFSDGPKNKNASKEVDEVRNYLHSITGFKKIKIFEANINKGLAKSIIYGVSKVFEDYDKVIVVEDDLITSQNFLDFMNQGLEYYKDSENIFSISGYSFDLKTLNNLKEDYYFGVRSSSWGWGTWKYNWETIDWEVKSYSNFKKDKLKRKEFNKGGSDLSNMLDNQMNGKIDSWAIRFCYQQFLCNKATVFPKKSKVQSIGFSEKATHTHKTKRFNTTLDVSNKRSFTFEKFQTYNDSLIKEFYSKFSLYSRLKDKFLQIIN